jgi:hypothetical protein
MSLKDFSARVITPEQIETIVGELQGLVDFDPRMILPIKRADLQVIISILRLVSNNLMVIERSSEEGVRKVGHYPANTISKLLLSHLANIHFSLGESPFTIEKCYYYLRY